MVRKLADAVPDPGRAGGRRRRPDGGRRRGEAARAARDPAAPRERGRLGRPPDARALGRRAAGDGDERAPGYVSELRKVLGNDVVQRRGSGYAIEVDPPPSTYPRFLDVRPGEIRTRPRRPPSGSARRWRSGVVSRSSSGARLEGLRLAALRGPDRGRSRAGPARRGWSPSSRLVEADPLRERPRAQLMVALYRSAARPTLWPRSRGRASRSSTSSASSRGGAATAPAEVLDQDPSVVSPAGRGVCHACRRR